MDGIISRLECWGMGIPRRERRQWFLRHWRKHRGLSQEALASRIGATQGLISQLENNKINYTRDQLEQLADALQCEPVDLLIRNPLDPDAPWSIWDALAPPERKQAIEIMKVLKRQATG